MKPTMVYTFAKTSICLIIRSNKEFGQAEFFKVARKVDRDQSNDLVEHYFRTDGTPLEVLEEV